MPVAQKFVTSLGNTPLHYACCGGYEDVVVTLLDAGASIEETNENGHTPLMEAASAGHVGVAKILLDRGAGINTHSNEFKESALTLACYKGHLEMVKFLLEAGADQEHKTGERFDASMRRRRPIFLARSCFPFSVAKILSDLIVGLRPLPRFQTRCIPR